MTSSVNISHPMSLWECASPLRTVNTVFNNRTPSRAQSCRCGEVLWQPISSSNSWYIFLKDGGNLALGWTENANPCAWLGPWYGSWPKITTLISSNGVKSKAW